MNTPEIDHSIYIRRCIEIAQLGQGNVSPNPMVGSVIVHNGKIIGEGYHQKYGEAHAEVNAIHSVSNKSLLEESTIYVSLEPCSHFGKTPPCADLIINSKIPRVVIGMMDPHSVVCGNGINKLKAAGIDVKVGVLEKECEKLNIAFNTYHREKRPQILLKWAQTSDGFIDGIRNSHATPAAKISNQFSSLWVHKLRSEVDAILVGTQTAILDNPSLTTRHWPGKNPLRIVLDKDLKIPQDHKILNNSTPTLILNSIKDVDGVTQYMKIKDWDNLLNELMDILFELKVQSILVEGGSHTLTSFVNHGLWDSIYQIISPNLLKNGIPSPELTISPTHTTQLGTDTIHTYEN